MHLRDRTQQGRRRGAVVAATALLGVSCITAASSLAQNQGVPPPTISGTPVVGATLTAHTPGDTPRFKWQRCNPAASDCSGGDKSDPNYDDIPGAAGPDARTYRVTASDRGFFIRVLAKDTSLGTQFVPSEPVGPVRPLATTPSQLQTQSLAPEHGVNVLGQTTDGTVRFKPRGANGYTSVSGIMLIPVFSIIDARNGGILLTAATGEFGNRDPDNSMEFFDGRFRIKQSEATDAPAVAKLLGKPNCGHKKNDAEAGTSAGPVAKSAARRPGLWGRGRGNYRTRGRGGTGSVVGTTFFTKNTCAGTFWKVTEGIGIRVDPKGKRKDVFLGPGDDYFAEG